MKSLLAAFFVMCMSTFLLGQSSLKDCQSAEKIDRLGSYVYQEIEGIGDERSTIGTYKDGGHIVESNSVWLYFDVKKAGSFVFEISPLEEKDDIDFVLFESTDLNCDDRLQIRSVMSGANNLTFKNDALCTGATGLSWDAKDTHESSGCAKGDDNFVQAVEAYAGSRYYLLINNYYNGNGFRFKLDGDIGLIASDQKIEERKFQFEKISIYPNPASEQITIGVPNHTEAITRLQISDLQGKILRTIQVEKNQEQYPIDISALSSGTYIVTNSDGNVRLENRFIKL